MKHLLLTSTMLLLLATSTNAASTYNPKPLLGDLNADQLEEHIINYCSDTWCEGPFNLESVTVIDRSRFILIIMKHQHESKKIRLDNCKIYSSYLAAGMNELLDCLGKKGI